MESAAVLKCPECGSTRVFRDGFRPAPLNAVSQEPLQRFRCADYGHRWSEQSILNTNYDNTVSNHVRANLGAKNMVPTQETKTCARLRTPTQNELKAAPQIERFVTELTNDGRPSKSVKSYKTCLQMMLNHGADLFDAENCKAVLSKAKLKGSSKQMVVTVLKKWFEFNAIAWKPPTYNKDNEIPYIPTEEELDQLIACLGPKSATFCQILKETGARSGELSRTQWSAIDFKNKTINIIAEKRSNGRILPLSDVALTMLSSIPRDNEKPFAGIDSVRSCFRIQRNKAAKKLANPNLKKIHLHTFRHWKATNELHLYHDREQVQIILGHKHANSTETYVHIDKMLYLQDKKDNFIVKRPKTEEEEDALINVGFEFVRFDEKNRVPIYRKRK
jgi:integrase